MPDDVPRIYWDACVFLSLLNGDPERIDVIKQLMDEAEKGQHELVTRMSRAPWNFATAVPV
ncbi:MAG TPA: hypothetical protein VIL96_04310 [Gaiellaceae bacterium]|jgi:uridine phosphorylase